MDRFILAVASGVQWLFSWIPFYGKTAKVYTTLEQFISKHPLKVIIKNVYFNPLTCKHQAVAGVWIGSTCLDQWVDLPDLPEKKEETKETYFKDGDEVVCIRESAYLPLTIGKEYKVSGDSVDVDDGRRCLAVSTHFKLKSKQQFNPGDTLICLKEWYAGWLTVGKEYKAVKIDDNGFVRVVGDMGHEGGFPADWFKVKEDEPKRSFKEGDEVVCVKRCELCLSDKKKQCLTVGKEYKIVGCPGYIISNCVWTFNDNNVVSGFGHEHFQLKSEWLKDIKPGDKVKVLRNRVSAEAKVGYVIIVKEINTDGNWQFNDLPKEERGAIPMVLFTALGQTNYCKDGKIVAFKHMNAIPLCDVEKVS